MPQNDDVFDSPTGWVNKHIQRYIETDGREGHIWQGIQTLLLTTRGRKSGKLRRTALIYGQDGDNYMVVASRGGASEHPAWYLNLVDDPMVDVQVADKKFKARAHTASPEEKARLWPLMTAIFPTYNSFQAKTKREIPVVVLVPTE